MEESKQKQIQEAQIRVWSLKAQAFDLEREVKHRQDRLQETIRAIQSAEIDLRNKMTAATMENQASKNQASNGRLDSPEGQMVLKDQIEGIQRLTNVDNSNFKQQQ